MRVKFIIFVSIVSIIVFHFNSFLKKTNKYEILQIDNIVSDYNEYFRENLPIVIRNNDMKIFSPLTIRKKVIVINNNNYFYHIRDRLFICSKQNEIRINIIAPNQISKFSKTGTNNGLKTIKINDNTFSYIQVVLKPGIRLYIPRYWIFNVEDLSHEYEVTLSDTVFSILFGLII